MNIAAMTEPQQAAGALDDSSRSSLGIMAAAAEHVATAAPPPAVRRPKLVLPKLTPAMQQDLAMAKGSSAGRAGAKPLSIGARPEFADYALRDIATPHPNDVLCGRGGGSNNHPGNESFRELVNEVKFPYVNCPKREKPLIARRIVEAVRNQTPPGRFLSKDSGTGLWNDIGDGKAREKTSQALREGAPILRNHLCESGTPSSPPSDVATVLKEAKRAERAEKECGARLPRRSPKGEAAKALAHAPVITHRGSAGIFDGRPRDGVSPIQSKNGPAPVQRALGVGEGGPRNPAMSHGGPPMPPIKEFRPFPGEREMNNGPRLPTAWPPMQHPQQQPGRNFNMMPYGHHPGPMMGPADYNYPGGGDYPSGVPGGRGMPPPPGADSVPLETVRRLLLGQLDPVQLALQILPPDEAAAVFRRHQRPPAGPLVGVPPAGPPSQQLSQPRPPIGAAPIVSRELGQPPVPAAPRAPPLRPPLLPIVSDGASSTSSAGEAPVPAAAAPTVARAQGGGDDGSSVDSARRSDASEGPRSRPMKKRRYIEEVSSS